jgi:hypothetical protein
MANEKKFSKREILVAAEEALEQWAYELAGTTEEGHPKQDEIIAGVQHEIDLLDKRAKSSSSAINKKHAANEEVKKNIVAFLKAAGAPQQVAQVANAPVGVTSQQHATTLLTQLKTAGLVTRTSDKEGVKFSA